MGPMIEDDITPVFLINGFLEAGKTEKAHEALRSGAEILAGTCEDILERPELLSEIKTEFRERKQKEKEVSF